MSTTEDSSEREDGLHTNNSGSTSRGTSRREDEHDRHLPANRLTIAEIEAVRELIKSDERARWFWSSLRIWLGWISGAIVSVYAIWDQLEKLIKKISG